MEGKSELIKALEILGEILENRHLRYDLAIVGGAALLLLDVIARSTMDLDAVALIDEGERSFAQRSRGVLNWTVEMILLL